MKIIEDLLSCLEKSPKILLSLLDQIPEHRIKVRRKKEKWSIHEQVCHLVEAQDVLISRFKQFEREESPTIKPYVPGPGRSDDHYQKLDLRENLEAFKRIRFDMVEWLSSMPEDFWNKKGFHDGFSPYGSKILLTHTLNVDYAHFFSIEQLGLTKEGLEAEILTLP